MFDLLLWLRYRYSLRQSKNELEDEETTLDLLWLLIPLIIILTWRLFIKERIGKSSLSKHTKEQLFPNSSNSEFYKLVALPEQMCFRRKPGETLQSWIIRIELRIGDKNIHKAFELHCRYRFDPDGLSEKTKVTLNSLVNEIDLKINSATLTD